MKTYTCGVLYGVPNVANPTPVPVAFLKGVSVDFKQAKKKFNGQFKVVSDVGDAELDIAVKIQSADFRASAFNMLLTGGTTATGGVQAAVYEPGTVPTTPFQVTVANAASFTEDGGVLDLTAGKWLTRGATATGAGVYAVTAGVYTFNAADTGHSVLIVYSFTPTAGAAIGQTLTYNNQFMGVSVPYKMRAYNPWAVANNGAAQVRNVGFDFASVHFEKLAAAFKTGDFAEMDLEGFASQDMISYSQNVFKMYIGE